MYARTVDGKDYTFGVSGMLYRSNVLMYDRQTESLWLQVKRRAVTGPLTGNKLTVLPSTITTWKKWHKKHPETKVLSFNTGHRRDYSRDPYEDYYQERRGMFRSFFTPGPGEEEKMMVIGIERGSSTRAYRLEDIREKGRITDESWNADQVILEYHQESDQVTARTKGGTDIPHVAVYWFVWKGIHPQSSLYKLD